MWSTTKRLQVLMEAWTTLTPQGDGWVTAVHSPGHRKCKHESGRAAAWSEETERDGEWPELLQQPFAECALNAGHYASFWKKMQKQLLPFMT